MLLCDTHADTLYALQTPDYDPAKGHIDRKKLTAPGVTRVQAMALWTGPHGLQGEDAGVIDRELAQLEKLKAQGFRQIVDLDEARPDAPNILLTIEGGEAFHDGPDRVDRYAALGVRIAALCWNNPNRLGVPAAVSDAGGLTAYGREVIARMNDLRMAVDASHMNVPTMQESVAASRAPIIASHSCARALCPHRRNLTDEQLALLFESGGYVGVNFYPEFLTGSPVASADDVLRHIDRMLAMGGEGRVGFGSDFDGIECCPAGLEDAGTLPAFVERMIGVYGKSVALGIAGENLRAYLTRVDAATSHQ